MKVTKLVDNRIVLENIYIKNETEPNRFEKQQEATRIEKRYIIRKKINRKKKYFIFQVNIL